MSLLSCSHTLQIILSTAHLLVSHHTVTGTGQKTFSHLTTAEHRLPMHQCTKKSQWHWTIHKFNPESSSDSVWYSYLRPPIVMGRPSYFAAVISFFFFLLFFLAYFHRFETGCLPYFHTWCCLSANLECMSEMCCTRLAESTARKNYAKNAICAPSHNVVGLYLCN